MHTKNQMGALGFDFKDDKSAYTKEWSSTVKYEEKDLGKEKLDRMMNNARWLIQEISAKLQ